MEKDSRKNDRVEANYYLAKLVLKQGALHSFHEQQLTSYIFASSKAICDGEISVDIDTKTVTYSLKTKKKYKRINKKPVKLSLFGRLFNKHTLAPWIFKEQIDLTNSRLKAWTKEPMWGDETIVKVNYE